MAQIHFPALEQEVPLDAPTKTSLAAAMIIDKALHLLDEEDFKPGMLYTMNTEKAIIDVGLYTHETQPGERHVMLLDINTVGEPVDGKLMLKPFAHFDQRERGGVVAFVLHMDDDNPVISGIAHTINEIFDAAIKEAALLEQAEETKAA